MTARVGPIPIFHKSLTIIYVRNLNVNVMGPFGSPGSNSANMGVPTEFEVKESARIRMRSDTSMDQEEKLIRERHEESTPTMKFIGVVAFLAILILVGWFLISY